eukprot:TRINITY_DN4414_c0_g1_i3.p1 TRINITY_DN4414_c0_g1~~TRINITY_DN4414_c0_g1_i3.p1  ORF type:complete len:327 (+),score=53.39 TRINITY_DN4414_c0_g1_i3:91-1071(+)
MLAGLVLNEAEIKKRASKITLVGCGAVGMACVYSILSREVVGQVVIVDVDKKKLRGEVMDLRHAGGFLHADVIAAEDDFSGTENSDIIIITAGVRQREGESRRSLLERNVAVFSSIVPPLVKKSPETLFLVVSNPCDTLTYITWKLSGLPRSSVFGSGTYLDSSRFRVAIAEKLGVNAQSVHGWIIGEHGDSSVPVWSGVNVAGINIKDAVSDFELHNSEWNQIHEKVKNSAYEVIQCKGYTNWAIGSAVSRIVECILRNERRVLPLSTLVAGVHGITSDVFLSLPCVLGQKGIIHVLEQPLSVGEREKLHKSAEEMVVLQQTFQL